VCGARLPRSAADTFVDGNDVANNNGFGPKDGKWLCELPFRQGGTFKCFMMEPKTVMDQKTLSNTPVYELGCEFVQGTRVRDQWTVYHSWKWFEKWHDKVGFLFCTMGWLKMTPPAKIAC